MMDHTRRRLNINYVEVSKVDAIRNMIGSHINSLQFIYPARSYGTKYVILQL